MSFLGSIVSPASPELKTVCIRCQKPFRTRLKEPPVGARWYTSTISRYCPECDESRSQAERTVLSRALRRGLETGGLQATRQGQTLTVEELVALASGSLADLSLCLLESDVTVHPLDWWYVFYADCLSLLRAEGFYGREPRPDVFQIVQENEVVRWQEKIWELPDLALLELFEQGAVRYVIEALERSSRPSGQISESARKRLVHPHPKVRFEALYVLTIIDVQGTRGDILQFAGNIKEHPRVRGLALEAIADCPPQENEWWQQVNSLFQTSLRSTIPEIRWWACFALARLSPDRKFYRPLKKILRSLVDDPNAGGLGWSVGMAAQDALNWIERGDERPLLRPKLPYDPWGSVW